jgi:hypothetical protein
MAIQKHVKISSLEGGGDNQLHKKKDNDNNHNINNNNNKNNLNNTDIVNNVNSTDVQTNFDTSKKNKKNIKYKKIREKLSSLTWATINVRTLGFEAGQSIDKNVQKQHFDKFPFAVLEATNRGLELVCLQDILTMAQLVKMATPSTFLVIRWVTREVMMLVFF